MIQNWVVEQYRQDQIMKESKNIYMLICKNGSREIIIGVFSSIIKIKECIKVLPKTKQYKIYGLPLNKKIVKGRNKLIDEMEKYLHHYFGTYEEHFIKVDKNDKIEREGDRKVIFWPNCK